MRNLINLIFLLFLICNLYISCKCENNLENSLWKYCGYGSGHIADILDFRDDKYFNIKNDSIYIGKDSLIGIIDKIEYNEIMERRLFVKDLSGHTGRYCED